LKHSKTELGINKDAILAIHVSRSIPEKGMEESIQAVIQAKEDGCSELHLALLGPENEYYKTLKLNYSSYSNIHFLGEHLNPIEWAQIADIGILPTYFPGESCPSTIVEYLACKLPVVSTQIGEISKMIEHNGKSGGILIPLEINGKPSVESLSRALHAMYSSPDLRKDLGLTAFQAFAKFDIAIDALEYMKIFDTALARS
jgi:glycosyltransferase involved in cell wall biosynthesis